MPKEIEATAGKRILKITIAFFTLAGLIAAAIAYIRWIEPDLLFVKGSEFQMGYSDCLDDEKPVHTVRLSDFKIAQYETTNRLFVSFLNLARRDGLIEVQQQGNTFTKVLIDGNEAFDLSMSWCQISYINNQFTVKDGKDKFPALVNWYGAVSYCASIDARLPTEAEWEYAAKSGHLLNADFLYSGGNDADAVAWHQSISDGSSHPVGQKQPNQIEIYDMSGNLREWVSDWYDPQYYANSPLENPQGPQGGSYPGKVMRGGSWREHWYSDEDEYLRETAIDPPLVRVTKRDYG